MIRELESIDVMCVSTFEAPSKAFQKLEKVVPLKGRKFYGVFNNKTKEYKACVKIKDEDRAENLGLEKTTIEGGPYAYRKLEGKYLDLVQKIPGTFEEMAKAHRHDVNRPSVEFYKRFNEFILYLPILKQ